MKKFRFVGDRALKIAKWRALPSPFTISDVNDDTFSKSILNRMKFAVNGTKIRIRTWRSRYELSLVVMDDESKAVRKKQKQVKNKKAAKLKRQVKSMLNNESVIKYRGLLKKLGYNYIESLGGSTGS